MNAIVKAVGGVLGAVALAGGFYVHSQRDAIINDAITMAEKKASAAIGTQVKIGKVEAGELNLFSLESGSDIVAYDIEVFDKKSERIAKVDEAKVKLKLLSLYDDGVGAVDEIDIKGLRVDLKRRDDATWNINDINPASEGDSNFGAVVKVSEGLVSAEFDGKNIVLENISAEADCADMDAVAVKANTMTLGSNIDASGTVGMSRQIINANIDTVDIEKVLPYIPEDILPESLEIYGGTVGDIALNVLRRDDNLSYSGSANLRDGAVKIKDTEIKNIGGNTSFTDAEIRIDASAEANGQTAGVFGTIRTDTDEPFFDVHASSGSFAPSAVIDSLGVIGAAAFTAHLTGTPSNPQVDADISSDYMSFENLFARNIKTRMRYFNNAVYFSNLQAETFGGTVSGEVEVQAQTLAYNAHIKANDIDLAQIKNFADVDIDIDGNIFADVAVNGVGNDLGNLKIYGDAGAGTLNYQNFTVSNINSSFYMNGDNLTIDNFHAQLPNRGAIGLEGTVNHWDNFDLDFYGAHIDMAMAKDFDERLEISGLSDFNGKLYGDKDNPKVELKLTAVDGSRSDSDRFRGIFLNQPYDSLDIAASGSLEGVNVDKFEIEKDGKITWTVIEGTVGFTGDKKIDLRLDTIGARLEDIVALAAPDEDITGKVDNTIKITGTLDNPNIVGYVDFQYGSYHGMLLTGMRGDYYVEGDEVRLQVFNITSPMFDVVLNGTIDKNTHAMDLVIEGRDMDLQRFQSQFPADYPVSGHGTFEGLVGGTIENPTFQGQITSPALTFNGVELTDIIGQLTMRGTQVFLDEFEFKQGDGSYQVSASGDTASENIAGAVAIKNAGISELLALVDKKNDRIKGKLNTDIEISGTLSKPSARSRGEILAAEIGEYDLHDVGFEIDVLNNVAFVRRLGGKQGKNGEFNIVGSADLNGPIDLTCTARDLELGMIAAATNADVEMVGTTNFDAKIGGSTSNPNAEIMLTANGGIRGATFDLLRSHITFKDWIFDVKELIVQRAIGKEIYQATASGRIPIQSLYIDSGENVSVNEQMNLNISLDDADLSLLPVVSNKVAWAVGKMGGNVAVTGTISDPLVNGKISISDGMVKIKGMSTPVEHLNISTLFKDDRFDIETFRGNLGKGFFDISGGFNFANFTFSDYNFKLVANGLEIASNVFSGPLSGEFDLSEGRIFNRMLPKISGNLNLDKCRISVPSLPDSDDPLPEILMDINLGLGDKVHFYSPRLYNMFLTGAVQFEGTTVHPKTSGSFRVKRGGTLTYIQTVFDIKEGEALFNQFDSFMPSIHFDSEAKISKTKINLAVDGVLGETVVKLSSNPEMSETEIMQFLTFRDAYDRGDANNVTAMDVLTIGLQLSVLGDIEDTIRRTLGFDQFTLSRGNGSAFDTYSQEANSEQNEFNVFLGKYVTDKVMLRVTQGINGDKLTRYGVQYDINDNLGFIVEQEQGDFIFGIEARYNF